MYSTVFKLAVTLAAASVFCAASFETDRPREAVRKAEKQESAGRATSAAVASAIPAEELKSPPTAPSSSVASSSSWLATVQDQIRRSEYEVRWQEKTHLPDLPAAFQASNRAQNLRTYFTPTGIRVIPRTGDPGAWEWGLEVAGIGRSTSRQIPKPAGPSVEHNRVEYHRGTLIEWYINGPRGLEQGFTLAEPPASKPDPPAAPLYLDLRVTGTLSATLRDAYTAEFLSPSGVRVLQYGSPRACDAAGRPLPVHLELAENMLSIVVDDTDAQYPITIDPLTTSAEWTVESNQADAGLGWSLATAGDVNADGFSDVIIAAPYFDTGQPHAGRAFVYHGSASGLETASAWMFEGDQPYGYLGWSVATAGDVNADGYSDIIVSAHSYDAVESNAGRAYVFHGSADGLSASADWWADGDQANAKFGYSVATAGDVNGDGYSDVIIGAPYYDDTYTDGGATYVYHGSDTGLSETPDWTSFVGGLGVENSEFGYSVATAGDVNGDGFTDVVIGAPRWTSDQGIVFFFLGSSSGLNSWIQAVGSALPRRLGCSVATAGDVNGDGYSDVIVGGELGSQGEASEGWVGVKLGCPIGVSDGFFWVGESNNAYARFGNSVGTAGDVNGDGYSDIIVGAYQYSHGESFEGGAFVWFGSAEGLGPNGTPENADWSVESDQAAALFGRCVATAGDVNGDGYSDVIVGANLYDNGEANEGRAFVYHGSASGLATAPGWTSPDGGDSEYGLSIAAAGDVNGDGYSDFIVGAPYYDTGLSNVGAAYVYHGSETGPPDTPNWVAVGDQQDGYLGWPATSAGDVNGDGYGDVAIAAPYYDRGESDEGIALVYHGSPTGLDAGGARPTGTPSNADWSSESNATNGYLGWSLDSAGDVNGDGYGDVVLWIAAHGVDPSAVLVWHGSTVGLGPPGHPGNADWVVTDPSASFGRPIGSAGDVNGDGCSDVFVCDSGYDGSQGMEGRILIYHGSDQGLSGSPDWTAVGDASGMYLGETAASAGDVNGDGYSDIVVGAFLEPGLLDYRGAAYAFYGSPTGLDQNGTRPQGTPTSADWAVESDQEFAKFSESLASAGDVNGDGYSDVVVSAPNYDAWIDKEGAVFVWHGSTDGLGPGGSPTSADWAVAGDTIDRRLGRNVRCAGDVNGDGYADLIASAASSVTGVGRYVYLHYGNAGPGLTLRPQQRRADDSAPIALRGISDSLDTFILSTLGRTPYGRQAVALESEVEPLGTLFDGLDTQVSASYADTGVGGVELTELASGLTPGTPYHWRARLLYDQVTSPFQQHSRWITMPGSGMQETKLRTPTAPPIVADDDYYETPEDTPLSVDELNGVLPNDHGGSGPFTAELVSDVSHGELDLYADGSFDYIPDPDYHGPDSFTYRAHDGFVYSNDATVTIDVTPVNDPPAALDDAYETTGSTMLIVLAENGVLVNDFDIDEDDLSAELVDDVSHGVLSLSTDGSFTYNPTPGYTGLDSFTYQAFDGQVYSNEATVTINLLPRTLYVDDDAEPGGNGTSWLLAYRYLQDALYEASIDPSVDEIHVGQGTYHPDEDVGGHVTPDDPNATFTLVAGVAAYGGYCGLTGGGDPNDRDPSQFVSVLSGTLVSNHSYHVVTASGGAGQTRILDGFLITGGEAYGPSPDNQGGGMYVTSATPTVANCAFSQNEADYGGGLANIASTTVLTSCVFDENTASYYGGGVFNHAGSDASFTDCYFLSNATGASGWGGGMYCYDSSPQLVQCFFIGNTAQSGGGMHNYTSSPILTECTFTMNTASGSGGALHNYSYSGPTLMDCTFTEDQAQNRGGAVHNYDHSSPTMHSCRFESNEVLSDAELGAGGALCNEVSSGPALIDCVLRGNVAPKYGGAVCNYDAASADLFNCALTHNSAGIAGGGLLNNLSCTATLQNCTIAGCSAPFGAAVACDAVAGYPSSIEVTNSILWNEGIEGWIIDESVIVIAYSDVEGGPGGIETGEIGNLVWGDGNLDADPLFAPGPLGYLYLSQTTAGQPLDSQCVDAGSDLAANLGLEVLTTRIDLVTDSGVLDLGYHYPPDDAPFNPGDCNRDGFIDLADYTCFADCATSPCASSPCVTRLYHDPDCTCVDFELDGDVDLLDFAELQRLFTGPPW